MYKIDLQARNKQSKMYNGEGDGVYDILLDLVTAGLALSFSLLPEERTDRTVPCNPRSYTLGIVLQVLTYT